MYVYVHVWVHLYIWFLFSLLALLASVQVCVRVWMCLCVYICMCACMNTCIHMIPILPIPVGICWVLSSPLEFARENICLMHVCVNEYLYTYSYIYTYVHIFFAPPWYLLVSVRVSVRVYGCAYTSFKISHFFRFRYRVAKTHRMACNLSCKPFPAKEPLITWLFCGKWPIKIRHPMGLHHSVACAHRHVCVCVFMRVCVYVYVSNRMDWCCLYYSMLLLLLHTK